MALLAVLVLALPDLARWLRSHLPAGAETAIHLFRAVQLDWAVRHGYLYPRWSPDLVFGFGYPLFLVHGPVAQYVIVALHALGLSFIAATLAAFALADLLGALGAFALARRLGRSDLAGVAAAAAYVYAPYVLGSLYRGSPAEALALGLLPWVLLAFLRLLAAHDMDLLFNRQLRIHRNNMAYQLCFQRANSVVEDEIESIWAEALGIPDQPRIARNIFSVVSDLFYQRVTRETLNYAWMVAFLAEVNGFMRDVIRSSGIQLGQAG